MYFKSHPNNKQDSSKNFVSRKGAKTQRRIQILMTFARDIISLPSYLGVLGALAVAFGNAKGERY
jgi:hypothetical protein